ncbi:MAG: ATP-dependent DNA helicase RecG [Desulfobacterales bacterium]|nr:ATP-dependent DNA helicase RecG [Desulfobacterales bacterium]
MVSQASRHLEKIPELNQALTSLKGIGAKRAGLFSRKGLTSILDILFFMPIRYEDRTRVSAINEAEEGQAVLVKGHVVSGGEEKFFRRNKGLFKIFIRDETGGLELLWFQYKRAYFTRFLQRGSVIMAYGTVQENRGRRQMVHPDIKLWDREQEKDALGLYPVYSAIQNISGQLVRSLIRQALDRYEERLVDAVPRELTHKLDLPTLGEAVKCVHMPPEGSSVELFNNFQTECHKRLIFDRFFNVMLSIAARKRDREKREGPIFSIPEDLHKQVRTFFPFNLTGDQVKTIKEILEDFKGPGPMNRLLQGDVGCGKTVVAAGASYAAILNKRQVAIMVPTQVLGQQHYVYFLRLSEAMGFRPVLLTGELNRAARLEAYERIRKGEYNLVIGTQALIQEGLFFAGLGLVIIDEQHRFGVGQRALLDKKALNPHVLVMSATPIPRTLAMTIYADLDISTINEYPEGHKAVKTLLVDRDQKRYVFDTVEKRMSMGQQTIVICPVIQGSEEDDLKNALEMYAKLKRLFSPRFKVGLIHGRLPPGKKNQVMEQFRDGLIDLLVGTTVIEVGVHAEGATVMVVEHPERFGLTQLHQLRGRVGRGSKKGTCFLMVPRGLKEETLARLRVMVDSNDGFEIAQRDLEIRGQGELMGIKQAGSGELDFMEMFREPALLQAAKREADLLLESDPELSRPENMLLKGMIESTIEIDSDF